MPVLDPAPMALGHEPRVLGWREPGVGIMLAENVAFRDLHERGLNPHIVETAPAPKHLRLARPPTEPAEVVPPVEPVMVNAGERIEAIKDR